MSSQINVTRKEFQESYKRHYELYLYGDKMVSQKTRRLVLFYSVECGLKSLILKNIGKNTYEELKLYSQNKGKQLAGHNISAMLQEMGLDKHYHLKSIRLKQGGMASVERFNEMWRYGAKLQDETEEQKAEKVLKEIAERIGKM